MIFKEIQKFQQLWIWIVLILAGSIAIGTFGYIFYEQIINGQSFGNNQMSDTSFIVTFILLLILFLLLFLIIGNAKLITLIDKRGIEYRFIPFQFKTHMIDWGSIESFEVISYHPIREYGGWGIRFGKGGKRAYNVSGNKGLQLYLKNGKQILIGTQKDIELKEFLTKLK